MPGIVILPSDQDRAAIGQAAKAAGLSVREFCRRAAVEAAGQTTGRAPDVVAMVRAIHRAVCLQPASGAAPASTEASVAQAALEQIGMSTTDAAGRVRAIVRAEPGAQADQIIKRALTKGAA